MTSQSHGSTAARHRASAASGRHRIAHASAEPAGSPCAAPCNSSCGSTAAARIGPATALRRALKREDEPRPASGPTGAIHIFARQSRPHLSGEFRPHPWSPPKPQGRRKVQLVAWFAARPTVPKWGQVPPEIFGGLGPELAGEIGSDVPSHRLGWYEPRLGPVAWPRDCLA
jgi:hypothetical protein